MNASMGAAIAGLCAGALNGLFGAGGGLVLIPLMQILTDADDQTLFSGSVAILFPICIISLLFTRGWQGFPLLDALPYLLGSLVGGICALRFGRKIPTKWLHRILGILILWGGIRYIW